MLCLHTSMYIHMYIYIGIVRESSWWHDLPPEGPDIHLRTVALASWSVLAVVAVWLRLQGINRLPVIAASFWQSWIVHSPVLPRQQMMVTNSHWEGCRELCQTDSTPATTLSLEPPWHLLGLGSRALMDPKSQQDVHSPGYNTSSAKENQLYKPAIVDSIYFIGRLPKCWLPLTFAIHI